LETENRYRLEVWRREKRSWECKIEGIGRTEQLMINWTLAAACSQAEHDGAAVPDRLHRLYREPDAGGGGGGRRAYPSQQARPGAALDGHSRRQQGQVAGQGNHTATKFPFMYSFSGKFAASVPVSAGERFIFCQDRSAYILQQDRQTDQGNI
jgi:hypothetical protein